MGEQKLTSSVPDAAAGGAVQLRQVETRVQEGTRERLRSDTQQGKGTDASTAQAV